MQVVSLAPVPVASLPWRLANGPWTLSVICKLPLNLEPGEAVIAKRHDPIYERDRFPNDDPGASLYAPSDLVPHRPLVDVSVVGNAYAPRGGPVKSLAARLCVQSIEKLLSVTVQPVADDDGFKSASLGYEFAEPTETNPVGTSNGSAHRIALMMDPTPVNPRHTSPGFGPIASHWPSRQRLLKGNAEPRPTEEGAPCELPAEFDMKFFNSAPPDQQLPELRPNAELVLENLHPDHAVLRTRLPNIAPQIFVEREGSRQRAEAASTITGLWIDTRRSVATLTYHCTLQLQRRDEPGKVWVAVAGPGRRLTTAQLSKLIGSLRSRSDGEQSDTVDDEPTTDEDSDDPLNRTVSIRAKKRTLKKADSSPPRSPRPAEGTQTSVLGQLKRQADDAETTSDSLPAKGSHGLPGWVGLQPKSVPPPPPTRAHGTAPPSSIASPPPPRTGPPPMRPAAMTVPGIGPHGRMPPSTPPQWPSSKDRMEDTSSLPKLEPQAAAGTIKPRRVPDEVVEMLWFDEEADKRLRHRWPKLCDQLDFAPRDAQHDLLGNDARKARSHHLHFGVMTEAACEDQPGMRRALREAISEKGRFTPPVVLLRGTLRFPFEAIEILRATAATVKPVAGDDKKLKAALEQVDELLATPLLSGSSETVTNFVAHLRKLYKDSRRSLSVAYLDEAVERMLLEQRKYQKRTLFGGTWIRSMLMLDSRDKGIPTYLPEALDNNLPMMVSFSARIIAEAHVKQDQYESHAYALRVVTLGRVIKVEG